VSGEGQSYKKLAYLVVEVPSVIEIVDLAVLTVSSTRFSCICKVTTKRLCERDFTKSFGTLRGEGYQRSGGGKEKREKIVLTFSSMS
jgi:hypothetical protein